MPVRVCGDCSYGSRLGRWLFGRCLSRSGGRRPTRRRGCGGSVRSCHWSGAIGPRVFLGEGGEALVEELRSVAGTVVAEDTFHGDPERLAVVTRASPKRGRALLFVIREDLWIEHWRIIIDGGMQKGVTGLDELLPLLPACVAAQVHHPPSSGMRPSFFASICTRSPGFSCS
jgi:hypothetical protein